MYLLIDNFDSFTLNLAQYLGELGAKVEVYRNNAISVSEALALKPEGIVLSPGPCGPEQTGICLELTLAAASSRIPLLGVCLGHQVIGHVLGATVGQCHEIVHGKTAQVCHDGTGLFAGLASPFTATRYHSLEVVRSTLPDQLEVNAWLENGVVMGIRHRELPMFGVQFHPESIATPNGHRILKAFLETKGNFND